MTLLFPKIDLQTVISSSEWSFNKFASYKPYKRKHCLQRLYGGG
jgi:hypothetical protein